MGAAARSSERVLLLAPTGADAVNISSVLAKAAIAVRTCRNVDEAATCLAAGAGALLFTEETMQGQAHMRLATALEEQPPWSDLPIVVVASHNSIHRWATGATGIFGHRSNITLLERPLRGAVMVAAIKAVLRARKRQYELRDLWSEREALLGSLEKRVQERTAKLEGLIEELESFSYSVSHDLRAPLRVMAGYAKVILEDHATTLVPEVHNYVERIAKSAEKMDRLTQDVLAYTRLARGEINLERINLDTAVQEVIDQYPELATAHHSIAINSPLGVAIAHGPSLAQALSNLLGNALKFARRDTEPRVEVFTRSRGKRLRVVVKDNGIGIERHLLKKIFGIFVRGVNNDTPGTGIGLAIVKKAAERMSGTVGVNSKPGIGSQFWIELEKAT